MCRLCCNDYLLAHHSIYVQRGRTPYSELCTAATRDEPPPPFFFPQKVSSSGLGKSDHVHKAVLNSPSFFIPTQGYPSHLFSNPFPIPIVDRYPKLILLLSLPSLNLPLHLSNPTGSLKQSRGPAFCSQGSAVSATTTTTSRSSLNLDIGPRRAPSSSALSSLFYFLAGSQRVSKVATTRGNQCTQTSLPYIYYTQPTTNIQLPPLS